MELNSKKSPPSNEVGFRHMNVVVTSVSYLGDYRLRLTFKDGATKIVDLKDRLQGRNGVFAELLDKSYFAKVKVNAESGTIEWPNEVDWAPDVLYQIGEDL